MGIKMNTYAGGQMTAGNDAILHDRAIANTGILHGCNITFMGANQVHIKKGYLLIKGRYCTVTEDTIQVAMSNSETELPGRLYVRADLADAQEPVKILSVAADPLPKLTQDENFNYDNGVWEVELATYTAGMTAIKDLTVTCEEVPEGASKKETAALLGKIDELTENLGDLTFAQDADGNWGYKVGGADPVIPFGGNLKPLVLEASQSYTADQSGYVLAVGAAANGNGSNLCSVTIKKNGNAVTPKFATANSLKLGAAWIPVDKGDVISIIPKGVNSNYQASMICFI